MQIKNEPASMRNMWTVVAFGEVFRVQYYLACIDSETEVQTCINVRFYMHQSISRLTYFICVSIGAFSKKYRNVNKKFDSEPTLLIERALLLLLSAIGRGPKSRDRLLMRCIAEDSARETKTFGGVCRQAGRKDGEVREAYISGQWHLLRALGRG